MDTGKEINFYTPNYKIQDFYIKMNGNSKIKKWFEMLQLLQEEMKEK